MRTWERDLKAKNKVKLKEVNLKNEKRQIRNDATNTETKLQTVNQKGKKLKREKKNGMSK